MLVSRRLRNSAKRLSKIEGHRKRVNCHIRKFYTYRYWFICIRFFELLTCLLMDFLHSGSSVAETYLTAR